MRGEIVGIVVRNSELPEPYCYQEKDENGEWVGIGSYDPEKEIQGEVIITPEGYVYTYSNGAIGDYPLGEENFEGWKKMVGDKEFPSARVIEN